ncbi:hypothetical protein ACFQDE_04850 [Deinococcus caeni]|uniref:hypothetical protein n=1 Tax=Deinococcus caeni TaxID=569127 RepID=UPI003612FBAC
MSIKDKFTPDEWFKVMTGPGRAGAAVMAASPSGLTGLIAEARAFSDATRESVSAATRTPLLEAMAADMLGTAPDTQPPRNAPATPGKPASRASRPCGRRLGWSAPRPAPKTTRRTARC